MSLSYSTASLATVDGGEMNVCNCRVCGHRGSDLQMVGCGCTIHARCAPLCLVINERNGREDVDDGVIPKPVTAKPYPCPVCRMGQVTGIVLFPISLADLNQAVELRKRDNRMDANSSSFSSMQPGKRPADDSDANGTHDVSYLLLSHSRPTASNSTSNEPDHHRTGRWTNDEIAFVDFLVDAFDKGNLPIPHGAKLNEFLGDMLLCKSSRLTKKMKNAKLSTRSYTLKGKGTAEADCRTLSELETRFLASVTDEPTKLELRFNMTKLWRMHFSNLCLQIGYAYLDARDWVAGLEEMERLASTAEESLRKARRRRIGMALQPEKPAMVANEAPVSAGNTPLTVFSSFGPTVTQQNNNSSLFVEDNQVQYSKADDLGEATCEDDDFLVSMMNIAKSPNLEGLAPSRSRFFSVDFGLDDTVDPLSMEPSNMMETQLAPNHHLGDCGPFLEEIVSFMQTENMPFQHVDVWVPSFVNADGKSANNNQGGGEQGQELRLFHAGCATRSDLDQGLSIQLNEFGQYSTNFTFAPSVGLPGRVYSSGKFAWERNIQDFDSRIFLRSGGAKVCGIKTGFGLPLESALVGRMVIVMYSTMDLEENSTLIEKCRTNFAKYTPEPKWKLVIDMASTSTKAGVSAAPAKPPSTRLPPIIPTSSSTSSLVHYSHDNNSAPPVAQRKSSFDHFNHDKSVSVATFSTSNVQQLQQQASAPASFMTRPERSMSTTSSVSQNVPSDMSLCPITPRPSSATNVPMEVSCTSTTSALSTRDVEDEEQRIATLLGDHMPLSEIPLPGENQNGAPNVAQLLPHFMSLRLLLLRSATRRSMDENDMIDVIKKSFRCYSKDNKRTGAELATLLAKDWMYLQTNMSAAPEKKPAQDQYQTHMMAAPTYGSVATNAGPTTMPSPFFPLSGTSQSSSPNLASHRLVSMPSLSLEQFNGKQSDNNSADGRIRSRSVSASSENTYADVVPEN